MIHSQKIHSLTEFVRNSKSLAEQVVQQKEPLGLTVNGKLKLIVLDPQTYEELWEAKEQERFLKAIEEGMEDVRAGRHRPADEVLRELRAKYEV